MKLLLLVLVVVQCVMAEDSYTDKYDTVNLDQVLLNKRLMVAYIKCMLDQGKCTSEGRELKCKPYLYIFEAQIPEINKVICKTPSSFSVVL
jgi:hypothetical protein